MTPAAISRRRARDAVFVTLAYACLTVAMTWPLVRGLARDVPGDLGDPLLNCWILSWDAEHLLRALSGHVGALREYWHANIYAPHPLALAYSEHLTAQAVQILPIYALTKNPLLCYNLLFLSSFVLSGLGMFLFVRDVTSSRGAAFVAGLAYAFAPYRVGTPAHLQVLSSAWMPFALFGFRRFFETRRARPLAGASAAWIAQNLSCGYYLLFFSPLVAIYIAWEMTVRRRWTDVATWSRLLAAGAVVTLATVPFLLPYIELRRLGFDPRSLQETDRFSADVYAYLTADVGLRVWGRLMRAWPKAEGSLFPGLTIQILAATAMIKAWRDGRDGAAPPARVERTLAWTLAISCALLVAMLLGWSLRLQAGVLAVKITRVDRVVLVVAALSIALLAASSRARRTARSWFGSPVGIVSVLTCVATLMSFGPHIHSRGRLLQDPSIYTAFYDFVPGFDGLRAPARFGMIVALGLAALAGYGAAVIERWRHGRWLLAAAGALIVVESIALPMPINENSTDYIQRDLAPLPAFVAVGSAAPPVYRFAEGLPASAILIELPFGEVAFETRYMFYSTLHWRKLVNGYSGGGPAEYGVLTEMLKDALTRPDRAWQALVNSQATHAIVHEASYTGGRGREISRWLQANGARELASFDGDRVFELPRY